MSRLGHLGRRCRVRPLAALLLLVALPLAAAAPRPLARVLAAAKHGDLDQAFLLAQRAANASPHDSELATVREFLRQRAALAHLQRAHRLQIDRHLAQAAVEYRSALAIDPGNADARQGLLTTLTAAPASAPTLSSTLDSTELRVRNAAPPVQVAPTPGVHAFHQRARLNALIATVTAAYGLRAYIAQSLPNPILRLDLAGANFAQAMAALHALAGVDWIPLDPHTLYFGPASSLPRIQPLASRTFYLPYAANGAALTQIVAVLKSLLAISSLSVSATNHAISVRATPAQLDAAEQLLLDLDQPPGEVLLEIRIVSLNATAARQLGVSAPSQFTMFALDPLLKQLQASGSLTQQILNLFEQGGINAVLNSGQLSPSDLASLQSSLSPLLKNPFVVFGGGATLMAVSVPTLAASLSATSGRVASVETALLRADSGQSAEIKIGQRYPVLNASFAPVTLNSAISKVIGNGTYVQPFPSFTYQDLGLDATLTPTLAPDGAIHLAADLSVKALSGLSNDNIPIISNRHIVTAISMTDNQPVMIAGLFNRSEIQSLVGLPGLSAIPGFASLFSTASPQTSTDQLALIVTPHVVALPPRASHATWLPASFPAPGALPSLTPSVGPRLTPPTPPPIDPAPADR